MKKLTTIATALMLALSNIAVAIAAPQPDRQSDLKAQKKALNDKPSKAARNEAKTLKKAGWVTTPGALPLDKQLDKSYLLQMETDDEGMPKYIMAEAMSIGENYDGAKIQALALARQNLASEIETNVTALIDNSVANQQLKAEEAATITKSLSVGKTYISQCLGRTITVVECYRTKENGNKEVLVRLAYSHKMAMEVAKDAIRQNLEGDLDGLREKLDIIQ